MFDIFGRPIVATLAISVLASTPALCESYNVRDFGAVGDGRADDLPAIQNAINKAIQTGPGNSVEIPSGKYLLGTLTPGGNAPFILIRKASGLAVNGAAGTQLVATSGTSDVFRIVDSTNVTLQSLQVDRNRLLFVQGSIESISGADKSVIMTVDPEFDDLQDADMFPARALKTLMLIYTEPEAQTFDHSAVCAYYNPGDGVTCWPPKVIAHQKLSEHRWRLALDEQLPARYVGKPLLLLSAGAYMSRVLFISNSSNVAIKSFTYFPEGAGNAVTLNHCSGEITFEHFAITTPSNSKRRLAGGGGFMVFNNRAHVSIVDSIIAGVWDDAFNMGGNFSRIYQQTSPSTVLVDGSREDFQAGDKLAIWDWAAKMERERTTIKSVACGQERPPTCTLELEQRIASARVGRAPTVALGNENDGIDRVINMSDVGTLDVRNSIFQSIHAHGLLVKTSDSMITGSVIRDTPMGGILVGPQFTWDEGPGAENLRIEGNTFTNVSGANIRVESSASDRSRDNHNIEISGNKFIDYGRYSHGVEGVPGVAVELRNVSGARVTGNSFLSRYRPPNQALLVEKSDFVTSDFSSR